jgi:Tfp pilus assembly PilM family ATPase
MLGFMRGKPCLGIEITSSAVRLAAITGRGADLSVLHAGTAELPPGTVTAGYATPNILDAKALADALRECLPGSGRPLRRAALSLPDGVFRVQTLDFDQLPAKSSDRARFIRWRIEKAAAFDLADTVLRYQVLRRPEKGFTVLACLAKQAVLSQYESALRDLGLEPWSIGLSSFHILNFYSPVLAGKSPVFALAHLADDSFSTMVTEAGWTRFYRYKEMKRGSAGELKARYMREIEDSLHFYTHMDRTQISEVQHLYLAGESTLPYELAEGLGAATSLSVEVLSPADVAIPGSRGGAPSGWLAAMAAALGAGSSI